MDDLISRKAVLDKAYELDLIDTGNDIQIWVIDVDDVKKLPAADFNDYTERLWKEAYERGKRDAQPIRCDECKYWDVDWKPAMGEGHYCPMTDQVTDGDEWCSNAERKSDG